MNRKRLEDGGREVTICGKGESGAPSQGYNGFNVSRERGGRRKEVEEEKKKGKMHDNQSRHSPQRHTYPPNETVLLNAGLPIPDQATGGER